MTAHAPGAGRRIPTRLALAAASILLAGFGLVFLIHVLLSSREGSPLALLIAFMTLLIVSPGFRWFVLNVVLNILVNSGGSRSGGPG